MVDKPQLDYSNLSALYINCTLTKSPAVSNTQGVINLSQHIMAKQGVKTEVIRLVDYDVPGGVYPDMTEYGYDKDDWPEIYAKVKAADILVVCGPIWLGDNSSQTKVLIERLYAQSGDTNRHGQYDFYGKVGGALITGNEDGVKHCAMNILYSLQHIGFTIPPQADAGWLGEIGPGPSYLDEGSGGPDNDFTNRNTTFAAWNMMHLAHILKSAGGYPAWGNSRKAWDDGERFEFEKVTGA